jgi:excisionase family DNA binding protein
MDVHGRLGKKMQMETGLLLTPEQAAHELGLGRTRLFDLIRSGALQSIQIGRSRRISRKALERFVAQLESEATA